MEIFTKVFKQTSWQLIGKGISSLATVIELGIITRTFGPTGTGVITLALTYLAFFGLAVDFGVNAYALPYLLKENYSLEWRKLFGFRLMVALIVTIIAIVLPPLFSSDKNFYQVIILGSFFAIFASAIYISANAIFQAKLRYDLSTIAYSIGSIIELGLIIFLSTSRASFDKLILAYVSGWIVISFISLLLVKKYIRLLFPVFSLYYFRSVIQQVWPIALTLILNTVYFRIDAFILSFFHSFSEVGVYNVAYSIFQAALVVPTFIMNAFYPIMIKNLEQDLAKFRKILLHAGMVLFIISLLGTVLTLLLSPIVITIITGGKDFSASATALQILSLSFPAFFISALGMWSLITLKKYKSVLLIYFIGLVVNLTLNLIFIPKYSFYAASYITAIAEYLILVLQLIILWKELKS